MRTFLWFALGSAALILIAAISVVASNGQINTAADDRSVARIAAIALIFGLIGGIVVMAGEITHGTVTQTPPRHAGPRTRPARESRRWRV